MRQSNQKSPVHMHSKTILILLIALTSPLITVFALYPWFCDQSMHYLDIWIFSIFACWLVYQFFLRSNEQMIIIRTYLDGFIVMMPCLLILFCLPLPAHVLKLLSSRIFVDTKWISTHADWIFNTDYAWGYLSCFPQQTTQLVLHVIACVLIFFLIIHTVRTRFQLNIVLYTLLGSLITGTLAGCLFFYDWSEKNSYFHINHHMALILQLLIPISLGVVLSFYKKTRKPVFKTLSYSVKASLKSIIWGEQAILTRIALIFFLLIGFLLFARSFGLKMLGLSFSLILGGLLLTCKPKIRSQFLVWMMTGFVIGIYALTSNTISLSDPFNQVFVDIARDYPLVGVGPGALPMVWSRYSDLDINDQIIHSSAWLEFLAEYGLLGMGFWFSAIAIILIRMHNMWQKRQRLFNVGWGLGIMISFIAAFLFGIGYNFGNPYIIMPAISSLAACGFLVLHAGHYSSRQAFFYRNVSIERKSWYSLAGVGLILFFLFWGIFEKLSFSGQNNIDYQNFQIQMESDISEIVKKNKFDPNLWFHLAKWYQKKNEDPISYTKKNLPKADVCFEIACYLAPMNHQILFDAAQYWVWRSQILSDKQLSHHKNTGIPGTKGDAIIVFQKKFRKILKQQPDKFKSVVDAIWQWYRDDAIVLDAIPEKPKHLRQTALEYVLLQKNN